jgi:hypothetical protein
MSSGDESGWAKIQAPAAEGSTIAAAEQSKSRSVPGVVHATNHVRMDEEGR